MATVQWVGAGQTATQVDTFTCTAVANTATITATIGVHSIVFTCGPSDTTTTAMAALFALLTAAGVYPEFGTAEITFTNPSAGVIVATSAVAGQPFTLTIVGAGGATVTTVHTTANSSPSDANNAANYLRSGIAALPQSGDDFVVANSNVPILWNLNSLSAVLLNSYTRYQSFTATIGLPYQNKNGYVEYRPTNYKLGSNVTALPVILGVQDSGTGPTRERYDFQTYRTNLSVLAAGAAQDQYSVYFLGTHVSNTCAVMGVSVAIATEIASVSNLASATVDGGGTLALGSGVTFSGTLTGVGGAILTACAPATLNAYAGCQVTVTASALTYATVTAENGATLTWLSDSIITTLTLRTGSILDKSQDPRAMTITNSTIDGDTCRILDPLNAISWTNATTVHNQVNSGPYQFTERTVRII